MVAALAAASQLGQAAAASAAPVSVPSALHGSLPGVTACDQGKVTTIHSCEAALVSDFGPASDTLRLTLPAGSQQCPSSGPGASCNSGARTRPAPGVSSIPSGMGACPVAPDKAGPSAPAACNDTLLLVVPTSYPSPASTELRVRLTSNANALPTDQNAILTATAASSMTGTPSAIEIFDQTTGMLVGACMQASQCVIAYAAKGGPHTFSAYITPPVIDQPTENVVVSNPVTVGWFGVALTTSSPSIVGPGRPVTFTATSTADVRDSGFQLGLYDQASGARLTYCSRGVTCSTTLTKSQAGVRSIVAYISAASDALPPAAIRAQSAPIRATWLGVTLDANTTTPQTGGTVWLLARSNVDVTHTPWSIGIYDQRGDLVGDACKSGTTCTAQVTTTAGSTPSFTAVIGATPPLVDSGNSALVQLVRTVKMHSSLVNIQAHSVSVRPSRLLWGVDSCKPMTSDPSGGKGLDWQVRRYWGSPDFWGRYLTTTYNCPGISSAEIAQAAYQGMGILPIYNSYDCSAVHGYATGLQYASEASTAAANLGIPEGTVLAIDIEPPGPYCPGAGSVDAGLIEGWYDGITAAKYAPMYYGNGTAGSEFGSAWCQAVSDRTEEIAFNSYLWSFEPSLLGKFDEAHAPRYSPQDPGCPATLAAWQFALSSGAKPDVDSDEAISRLPLWFPKS